MIAVRALLFDVIGTVVDWRGGLIARLEAWGAARGVVADWPGFVDAWRRASPPLWAQVRTGARDWANFDELLREAAERLAPDFGLAWLDGATLDGFVRMWRELPPWPDTVVGLQRLRTKYVIASLSNCHVALLVQMAKAAELPWDAVFGADVFCTYKPDPATYSGAAALLGCGSDEVMLVASHPSDLDGAAKCGLRTCYVSRPLEYGPGRIVEELPAAGRFDLMVDDLEALAGLMGC